ncbi:unnamed protein product [Lepeophtheirus salmonis]|uniref:(salmon louse) hypothetical protein n=1 Tax=Lepeophtheirus salmonis TaxID=72036 RepID=A0A7R8HEI8_LEPSM|nr:unnamed protein product [Lepeophtheirus salmonis]CAF3043002.1 unnamed protein product [Lepeophtheirus salmonis]
MWIYTHFHQSCLLFVVLILGIYVPENFGIKMYNLKVPDPLILGSAADLYCDYDMEGSQLYSVKWYKNGKEFFRYMPDEVNPKSTLDVFGVYVDKERSSSRKVRLKVVRWSTEGNYKCEVTAGKPYYDTVVNSSIARIVAAPRRGPTITGRRDRYTSGDLVELNCSSNSSKPATELSWYINSIQADNSTLIYYPIKEERDGRKTSILGIKFRLREHFFSNRPDVKIKCTAMLSPIYLKSSEVSLEVKLPQKAPALESREKNNIDSIYSGLVEIVDDDKYSSLPKSKNKEPTDDKNIVNGFKFHFNYAFHIHCCIPLCIACFLCLSLT